MLSLYAVVLGGKMPGGRLGEDPETVFIAAENEEQARANARVKWSGANKKGLHVDALVRVDSVDGYAVRLDPIG